MASNSGGNLSTAGPESGPKSTTLRLSDCLCPICMSILIEPVTMPCNHELCMPCFKQNVEEANFTCPMCRLRISNWARRSVRENRLINEKRGREILEAFPEQCRRRLEGEDDDDDDDEFVPRHVCKPGEIREEYEKELQRIRKQRQEETQKEVQRSEEYIQKLQQEEVKRFEEQQREQARLKEKDEEMAHMLSRKLAEEENRQKELDKQASEDARLAWKLHCDEQMMQSPRAVSNASSTSDTSRHRKMSNSSRSSSNSSVKCMRIDTFLTPTPKRKSSSLSPEVIVDKFDINMPGTSKDIVVLTPSPSSNLSFASDINKPGPSGLCQSVRSDSNRSNCSIFDLVKDTQLPRTPSVQSIRSSTGSDVSLDKTIVDLIDSKDQENSDKSPECSSAEKAMRCASEPSLAPPRSSSRQSHSSTNSVPCRMSARTATKENKESKMTPNRGRKKKKTGAFQTYKATSKERDQDSERQRSDSLSSVDSISHELSHFRPIQCSPRTARKKLADGSRESPPIIQATPRNLKEMKTPVETEGSPFIDPPPLVRAKFEKLVEERHIQVEATSKATMTSVTVQHWKKIARPEARMVSSGTKRKLSQFEYCSTKDDDTEAAGLMQPPKYQRLDPHGVGGKGKQRRTVGTQKTIPVKKRHIPVQMDMELSAGCDDGGGKDTVHSATMQRRIANPPKSWESKSHHTVSCSGDDNDRNIQAKPKRDACGVTVVKPTTGSVTNANIMNSGAKRKILMDDDDDNQIMSEIEANESCLNSTSVKKQRHIATPTATAKALPETSESSSLEGNAVSATSGRSGSDTSPSKVYKMKLKVSKSGMVGSSKVTPVKSSAKNATDPKTPSQDVAKRKPDVYTRGSPQSPSLKWLRQRAPSSGTPTLPSMPAACTAGKTTPIKHTADGRSSGSPAQSDINQSPENHRKGLRSQRLRNGMSPGKGILVETIQNGSKKDNTDVVVQTKHTRKVQNIVKECDTSKRKTPQLNLGMEGVVTPTRTESPKVKRSPRSRKKQQSSASPKVSSSSPRARAKSALSSPPALKSLRSPRTERRNTLWKYMELMTEEQKRLKQEEEDRRVALELQQEFDKQEKRNRNKVIRSKGSKDAYRLRHGSSSSVP